MNEIEKLASELTLRYGARSPAPVTIEPADLAHIVQEAGASALYAHHLHLSRLASRRRYTNFRSRLKKLVKLTNELRRQDIDYLDHETRHRVEPIYHEDWLDAESDEYQEPLDQIERSSDFDKFFIRLEEMHANSELMLEKYISAFRNSKRHHRERIISRLAMWWWKRFGVLPSASRIGPFVRLAALSWRSTTGLPDIGDVEAKLGSDIERWVRSWPRRSSVTENAIHDNSVPIR